MPKDPNGKREETFNSFVETKFRSEQEGPNEFIEHKDPETS